MPSKDGGVLLGDQFTELDTRLHPSMRGGSVSLSNHELSEKEATKFQWPPLLKMIFLWTLLTFVIFSPVFLAVLFELNKGSNDSLFAYVSWYDSNLFAELLRFTLFVEIIMAGLVWTTYSSVFIPQILAFLAKRNRGVFSKKMISYLELISVLWKHICYCFLCLALLVASFSLLSYPKDKIAGSPAGSDYWISVPWQFLVRRAFILAFVCSTLIVIEKAILHSVSKSFNKSLYEDRIIKCLFSVWTIEVLKKAAGAFNFDRHSKWASWKPEPCPFSRSNIQSVFILEHFFRLAKTSTQSKQNLSKKLYAFLAPSKRPDELRLEDLQRYFTKGDLEKAFEVLDLAHTGDITEAEFVKAVENIYEEQKSLIQVLMTNSDVIVSLDRFFLGAIAAVMLFSVFPAIGFPMEAFIPLGVACSIMFGDTIKAMVAPLVFLLASHPYDVGDRIYMDKGNFFVRRIDLLSTTFERSDGIIVYYPNSVLASKEICNVRRIGQQSQKVEVLLPISTPTQQLSEIETRMREFVARELHDYVSVRSCLYEMYDMNTVAMVFCLKHRHNFQLSLPYMMRSNKFILQLEQTIHDLNIKHYTTIRGIELHPPDDLIATE